MGSACIYSSPHPPGGDGLGGSSSHPPTPGGGGLGGPELTPHLEEMAWGVRESPSHLEEGVWGVRESAATLPKPVTGQVQRCLGTLQSQHLQPAALS